MSKFLLGAVATAITATAIMATPAHAISNDGECASEGGTMVNVKGSDFCLVPIRPEAYRDEIYDGNQLGVTECPGNKLNDGLYCMYPVTIRPAPTSTAATTLEATPASDVATDAVNSAADAMEEKVMDKAKEKAETLAKERIKGK